MANLSNINNKFLVTTTGEVLVGRTAATGTSKLQVSGSLLIGTDINSGIPLVVQETTAAGFAIGFMRNTNATNGNGLVIDVNSTGGAYIQDWRQASTVKMRLLQNGNLGIGTDSPQKNLQIFQAEGGIGVKHATIRLGGYSTVGPDIAAYRVTGNSNDQGLIFSTYDATNGTVDTMTLTNDGNVGIGTASPDTKLEVDGKSSYPIIKISASSNTSRAMSLGMTDAVTHFIDAGGSSSNLIFKTVGSERMRIFSNGNVNIGVAEAGASAVTGPFVVTHTSSRFLTSSYEESSVSLSAKNNSNNLETLRLAGDSIKFFNGTNAVGSQKMVILNNGNVGIGTTTPQNDKLHVETDTSTVYDGNSNQTGGLFVNNIYHEALNTFSQIRLGVSGASGASNVRLVGIEPSQAASDFAIVLRNGSVWGEKLRIKGATGHVGIGITSPGTPLQVSGITNNVSTWIGSGWVNNSAYHREGGLLGISGTNATQTSAGIAFQTRNTNNTNYWKSSILMNRGGELEFYLGGAGTGQGTRKLLITSGGRILMPGLDGKTQVHPDVSYRTSDGELFYQTSSKRYKTDIVDLENCLDKVNSLRTVRFTDTNTNEPGFGLIAEETNEIIPDVVFSKNEQIEGISYSNLVPFLIKSIQELKAEIELLKSK